jgi:GNAT superfamily N-acetyltransferase
MVRSNNNRARKKKSPIGRKSMTDLKFLPVTPRRWKDLVTLFGERGACGGCWCMWWRLKRSEFEKQKGDGNRRAMKKIVDSGEVPGMLAYAEGRPIAWCSVGPRESFPVLDRSRVLKRVDERPVWSVVCFFIDKHFRRKGISAEILKGAVDYAGKKGAKIIEGYPIDPESKQMAEAFAWVGLSSTFIEAGFKEVARRSRNRPIMRFYVDRG